MTFNEFVKEYEVRSLAVLDENLKFDFDNCEESSKRIKEKEKKLNELINEFVHTYVKENCPRFYYKLVRWNGFIDPILIEVGWDRIVIEGDDCCDTRYRCSIRPDKCSCYSI